MKGNFVENKFYEMLHNYCMQSFKKLTLRQTNIISVITPKRIVCFVLLCGLNVTRLFAVIFYFTATKSILIAHGATCEIKHLMS